MFIAYAIIRGKRFEAFGATYDDAARVLFSAQPKLQACQSAMAATDSAPAALRSRGFAPIWPE